MKSEYRHSDPVMPPALREGDFVGLVCTARALEARHLQPALDAFLHQGWRIKTGITVNRYCRQLGGTAAERVDDLNGMLADPDVKAVFIARGGFGHLDIVDSVDYALLSDQPAWICGFSDATVLHSHIFNATSVATLHAPMPSVFASTNRQSLKRMMHVLSGGDASVEWPSHLLNRGGIAEGPITGGNLSVLYALTGSRSEVDWTGKVLLIEEVDEYLYHLDRMMTAFRRAGKFDGLAGVVVGGMTEMNDHDIPFGESAEEIIARQLKSFDFPVCFGFPGGHGPDNRPLILGSSVSLQIERAQSKLQYS